MVLARKKLKQKVRTLLPGGEAEEGARAEVKKLKVRLVSSKRPRPKRPKKPTPAPVAEAEAVEEKEEEEPAVDEADSEEEPALDEAALAQKAEVERRREERRKEKKEKRRVRRLMEAEAAANKKPDAEAEVEQKSEVAGADPAVSDDDSEHNLDITKVEGEANNPDITKVEEKRKEIKSEEASQAVGSSNPIVPQESEQSIKKVYVGGIPYYSSEDDIRSFFEGCGSITALDCMTFPESGKFRGIAILTFKTDGAAQRALALDGADMGGFFLKVQPYKANREKVKSNHEKEDFAPKMIEGYNRMYVGNLAWDITEDDLRKFFSDCKISTIRFGTDKETGDFKGFAHVDFSDGTSLAIAMKLDQNVIKGRPVRIRCAVPKKESQKSDDNANSDPLKSKVRTCYECGTPGHLSFACPNKKASEVVSSENKGNTDSAEASSKKRRTCYECGVPGHLSSACPNKNASEVIGDENKANVDSATTSSKKRRTCYECGVPGHLSSACPNKNASEVIGNENKANVDPATTASKKRRTCYECGVPGHLSSACPNKIAAEAVSKYTQPFEDSWPAPPIASEQDKIGDVSNSAPSKRRKCYVCGISGHLSSACPNKQATEINCEEAKPVGGSSTVPLDISAEKKPSDDTSSAPPKKKKRRTCYECGIAGHLSSECPNKAAA
ncbi:unnamed protein product [Alopecurus aequalis]